MNRLRFTQLAISAMLLLPVPLVQSYVNSEYLDQGSNNSVVIPLTENEIEEILKKYQEDIHFIENVGQRNKEIRHYADFSGGQVRFLKDKVNYILPKENNGMKSAFVFNQEHIGSNINNNPVGKDCKDGYHNYVGKGMSHLNSEVWYDDLYDGIDLRYYSRGKGVMEHDYIVSPGANPDQIEFHYEGTRGLHVDRQGNLVIETPFGEVAQGRPYVYQIINGKEYEIESKYRLKRKSSDAKLDAGLLKKRFVSFELGEYNVEYALVIDPVSWDWATIWGGNGEEEFAVIRKGEDGCIYVSGKTYEDGTALPTTPGVHSNQNANENTLFISKFDADGELVFSTYTLTETDQAFIGSFEVADNCSFLFSTVNAAKFDNTTNSELANIPPGNELNGNLVQKFDNTGNLVWGTFIGGDNPDGDFVRFGRDGEKIWS